MRRLPRRSSPLFAPVDRRTAIKALGAASLVPWLGQCAPPATIDGLGPRGRSVPLHEVIDTVVVIMMENRSFDHYFGAALLEEGWPVNGLRPEHINLRLDGTPVAAHRATATCVEDPPHSWDRSHDQWAGGANSGFVTSYEQRWGAGAPAHPMGYFGPESVPTYYALAQQGTLCERWHCALLSSTFPNRFYSLAGQCAGSRTNELSEPLLTMPSLLGRLLDGGVTWADYFSNVPFAIALKEAGQGTFKPIEEFYEDAAAGALPNFSIVEPLYGLADDHPPAHPMAGQVFVQSVAKALVQGPQWNRSLLLVYYDEHGGFYDHVPPPTVPDDRATDGFDRLGFRVPALVVSPWAQRGAVSPNLYEHASMLAFVEALWGLEPLTQRDASANNMFDLLDMDRVRRLDPAPPPELPVLTVSEDEIYAPECGGPLTRGRRTRSLNQPELEDLVDRHPLRERCDLREGQEQRWEELLRRAERQGWLRRRV